MKVTSCSKSPLLMRAYSSGLNGRLFLRMNWLSRNQLLLAFTELLLLSKECIESLPGW